MKAFKLISNIALIGVFLGITTLFTVQAADKHKVVYHASDAEKVKFVLTNIDNHIKGVGGPENVEIVLVLHGPAVKQFVDIEALDTVRKRVSSLHKQGVQFNACGNTMHALDVELSDLLPGFVRVDQGGVVRIAELQSNGYLYIRP